MKEPKCIKATPSEDYLAYPCGVAGCPAHPEFDNSHFVIDWKCYACDAIGGTDEALAKCVGEKG